MKLTLKRFYENLFQRDIKKSVSDIETFYSQMQLPTTSDEIYVKCETDITEHNLFVCPCMSNNKYPGYDGFSKEFC